LSYFLNKPKGGDYLNDFSAKGYFDLDSLGGDCRVVERKSTDSSSSLLGSSVGKYLFRLKEQNNAIIFSATSEGERNEWVYLIQEAIRGVSHTLVTPSIPLAPTTNLSPQQDSKRTPTASKRLSGLEVVEFPKMVGSLKKKSIEGKKFGFKNIKTRCPLSLSVSLSLCLSLSVYLSLCFYLSLPVSLSLSLSLSLSPCLPLSLSLPITVVLVSFLSKVVSSRERGIEILQRRVDETLQDEREHVPQRLQSPNWSR
jgi:hypothetical protein